LDLGGRQKVRVVSDANNNALLIWGRESDYKKIENALRKLDVIPRQVMIEVNIFEVTLNNDLRYGVEWYFSHGAGSRTAGGGGIFPQVVPPWAGSANPGQSDAFSASPGVLNNGNAVNLGTQNGGIGIISQYSQNALPGFSYFLKGAGGDIRAMVNLLEEVSHVNMLASPHLLVTDHQSARIRVGEEVPLQMGQGVTTVGAVSSYDYRETGVLLSVTPHINPGGLISLQVSQEVSTPQQNGYAQIQSPVINKRALDTLVIANSGETIALGGLIRDDQIRGRRGIPILSKLPGLGVLFGSTTRASRRTELLLTMRPEVIADGNQAKEATEELQAKMKAIGDTFDQR
jgi:general secretion pathway protein D